MRGERLEMGWEGSYKRCNEEGETREWWGETRDGMRGETRDGMRGERQEMGLGEREKRWE